MGEVPLSLDIRFADDETVHFWLITLEETRGSSRRKKV